MSSPRITREDVANARPESLFLLGRRLDALMESKAWNGVLEHFAHLDFPIEAKVKAIIRLGREGEAAFVAREGEEGHFRADSTVVDDRVEAAKAWWGKVRNRVSLAIEMDVQGAEHLMQRLVLAADREATTGFGASQVTRAYLRELDEVDANALYIRPEMVQEGRDQLARFYADPKTQHVNQWDRQTETRAVEDICAEIRKLVLQIAKADVAIFDDVGRFSIGFDYGVLKSDRPDARPAPAPAPAPAALPPIDEPDDA